MNDPNQYSLGDALQHLFRKHGLEDTLNEHRLKDAWKKTVGDYCNKHTQSLKFSKGELTVKITSAVVKQELLYARTELIEKLNTILGRNIVTSLRIF